MVKRWNEFSSSLLDFLQVVFIFDKLRLPDSVAVF